MKHLEGCPSGDFGPCDCGESMTSPGNASDDLVERLKYSTSPDCWRAAEEILSLRAQLAAAEALSEERRVALVCHENDLAELRGHLQTARKALEEIEQLSDNCINAERYGAEDALEDLQAIRRSVSRFRSLDGAGK